MPGVVTIAPADAVEMRSAMRAMMETPGPMYLRVTRDPSPTIFPTDYTFEIGPAILLRDGDDVGLIGTGVQTIRVLEAADLLASEGISASVLHVPTLKPLDADAIVAIAERTGRIVTAEDHSIIGGLGSAVAEVLGERHPTPAAPCRSPGRLRRIRPQRLPAGEIRSHPGPCRGRGARPTWLKMNRDVDHI